MNILFFMIPATFFMVLVFLVGFIWAVKAGQMDDLTTPAHRALNDDIEEKINLTDGKDNTNGEHDS